MAEGRAWSGGRSWMAAWAATVATYVYFLIFAEFALLELARGAGVGAARLDGLLAWLGGGGVAGAIVAARGFGVAHSRRWLAGAFGACAGAALAAGEAAAVVGWAPIFAAVGFSLGALTVVLAAMLRRAVGGVRLGLCIGAGTGTAYALCNLPVVFAAAPRVQAGVAVAAALAGAVSAGWFSTGEVAAGSESPGGPAPWRWVAALLALVWMDSAVFFIIQHTPALRAETWEGGAALLANAGVHLAAGVAAGGAIDAGWRRAPAVAGVGLLAGASLMLGGVVPAVVPAGWVYVAGVSLYSVVLVHVPAADGRASVAAWVFAVAGWIGSGLGIGMAQDLHGVPGWFVAVGVAGVVLALAGRGRGKVAAGAVLAIGVATAGTTRGAAADDAVARGREIYLSEGCLHCHSQWVRSRVAAEVERWGPATVLEKALAEVPPLPGNRRQGPDLANVGNRRSAEWNRLHLQRPREVSPGSRMPSYAHLFRGDAADGEALVAYLASLGAETVPARLAQVAAWQPAAVAPTGETRARRMFAKSCANCHGPEGRGDGVLAAGLMVKPPDWRVDAWRRVPATGDREREIARVIKFGVPGTAMAGHEYLADADILGLARLVRMWHRE